MIYVNFPKYLLKNIRFQRWHGTDKRMMFRKDRTGNKRNRRIRTMGPERRKALRKTQKKCIAAQVVMCAAYISAGILLAVTGRHCVADIPIYIAGAVITAGCMAALAVFESRLSRELAG